MKRVGKRALSFTLAVLLIVSMLPTIAFAKTGDTPIVAFTAADREFIEGDRECVDPEHEIWEYNLEFTDYTVTTNDGESYTGPMWDVFGWLNNKYPGMEFDGNIDWDKTESPSQGTVGDQFRIVYNLDGFEAEWTLKIVGNPINEITARNITRMEGDTFTADGYQDAWGGWHEQQWQKYDFAPVFKVELLNGEVYESEEGNPQSAVNWIKDQTGLTLNLYWNDDYSQDPPTGIPAGEYGEYICEFKFGPYEDRYLGYVVENPVASVEARDVTRMEGDTFEMEGYDDAEGQWHEESWQKYDFSPDFKVTLKDGRSYESEDGNCWDVRDWVQEQTGAEVHFWWDDNSCQNPPTGIGVGEYTVTYELAGFKGSYKGSVVKCPIVSMSNDPVTIVKYTGSQDERDGYVDPETGEWIPDVKWKAYDTYPHNLTVKTDDGASFTGDWWDCRQWLESKYPYSFNDWSEGDTQTPSNEWGVGDYPITFHFGPASTKYTVSIVANPIQSVTAVGIKRLEGDKDKRDRYWDEEKQEEVFEEWEAYASWPESIKVVSSKGTFEGNPEDVRRDLAAALGMTEDEINRNGFGDINDDQSPTHQWEVGVHHQRFDVCGVYADYDVEIVKSPVKSITVNDVTAFLGNTYTEHGYWGPDGEWIEKDWQRYNTWPSYMKVEMVEGDPYEGEPNEIYNQVKQLVGFDFRFGDYDDGQDPDHPWGLGDHEVKFRFAGKNTTYNIKIVSDPIVSVTVNEGTYLTEGDTYTENGYRDPETGQWVEKEWQRYGYMPWNVTVKVKVKGTEKTYTGDIWELSDQIAEDLEISKKDIRVEIYDDQSPDNLWQPGEHEAELDFAGKKGKFNVTIVAFPVMKVSAPMKKIDSEDTVDYLDRYMDYQTDRQYWDVDYFTGYDVSTDEITITFKNNSKMTGTPGELQDYVIEQMMRESGLPREHVFFRCYDISDQNPEGLWEVGYHTARYYFGPVYGEYPVAILGDYGDYTGLYNDKENNRYIYLENGFLNPDFSGEFRGAVADVINKDDPSKTTYLENSQGVYDVKNGIVQNKEKKDVKAVFPDVKEGSWYVNAVQFVYDYGVMTGKGTGFAPDGKLKREEFVQILYSLSGKPDVPEDTPNPFKDVKRSQWFADAILWANQKGYVAGNKDGTFGVGNNIQREALVAILYKYAEANGYDMNYDAKAIDGYADTKKVSGWAKNAFCWAVSKGIISGKGAKGETDKSKIKLDPAGNASRAEWAAMMMRLMEMKQ